MQPALKLSLDRSGPIPSPCLGCPVRRDGICRVLGNDELGRLALVSVRRVVPRHEAVWRAGDGSGSVASLLSGVVSLSRSLPDGRQQIVALQFPTSVIGSLAGGRELETVAQETTRICSVPRGHFENILSRNPELEREVIRQIGAQLDEARNWLVAIGRKSAAERVATYLHMLVTNHRSPQRDAGPVEILLPLSRGATADFLGLTIETVSRKMTELKRSGIVDFDDATRMHVLSTDRLRAATGDEPVLDQPGSLRN
ncbi:Crp/Fnr family transcriptional regulator [Aureimonas sp. Leaf324]|uniref:Crp/Fnr family transcriptional regulator n=1 Tax=Aureimonas sp. Leaf324 TaxID=1736336 RepID=UPI0009E898C0|nr:Crp/Fnr family transcriptional regulator [Aureimonas sp. Leaf324]